MAALTITAANVAAGAGARKGTGTAGASITAGQAVYQDPADGLYKLSDSDGASAAIRTVAGIALHGALSGQPLAVHLEGPITIGATLTPGVAYYASPTAGGIGPVADLITSNHPIFIGFATSASVLDVHIHPSGVVL